MGAFKWCINKEGGAHNQMSCAKYIYKGKGIFGRLKKDTNYKVTEYGMDNQGSRK